ncbi:MAG: DUF362 domain-containing protein [Candidatus Aminicenantes bacterium]|nr:MAG: DUF362 domain-containing protein [Candidatus Aminicenantes bacterium]
MSHKGKSLTRRDFLRGTLGTTLGVSVLGTKLVTAGGRPAGKSLVTLVRDQNAMDASNNVKTNVLKTMLDQTLIKFTGKNTTKKAWLSLVTPKDTIGLVPTPHLNPTHQEVTDAVTSSLIEAGIPEGKILNAQGGPDKPEACTALIGLPALKAHWLTGIGTVLKLYILYSGNPRNYHAENNAKLGEIWNLPCCKGKTRLVLVDALHPLFDKGPQVDPRYKWAYNGLIAGTDPVALETVCLRIIMEKRKLMKGEPWPLSPPPLCVEAADKDYGLGTSNWDNIKVENYGWEKELLLG